MKSASSDTTTLKDPLSLLNEYSWYDDNGDNTLFSTLMTLGRATRILLSKKSKTD